ncbi:FAD-binding oxidoreductase [Granulicella sp. L46]|uniref:FAD-binding oxidoreductase n=1 Tax=Granulicella sp. L46 TaxID=1641865 RepID=UPI00131C507C|nr:FAD-binding oxidoreductase [Granulicella sp. L46]
MDRRAFLWQGVCSSLPLLGSNGFVRQPGPRPVLRPSESGLSEFAKGLSGTVFRPGDTDYERLRKGYAAKYAGHPVLVVHAANAQDIQATVKFSSSNHLPLAVRCGGHSYAGYSTCDGGIVLDMSGFRSLAIAADEGHARLGGGMLCGGVEVETAKSGLATVLGQCPSVGVGGFLLGGGVGPLMGKYGLGCDNVLAAELVLADGRHVRASEHENPDLYWAIRGGGGNFGIVTEFVVTLHPVSRVLAGIIVLESADLGALLREFREFIAGIPDELTVIALVAARPGHKPQIVIEACYVGDPSVGEKLLAPLRHQPSVVHDAVQIRSYLELEQVTSAEIPPRYEEHCSGFFTDFDDQRIEILADAFSRAPFLVECFLVHLHGAVSRVPVSATAFPLRRAGITFDVSAGWTPPDGQRAASDWIEALKTTLPVDGDGNYVNVMEREGDESVRLAYGANYARLQQVKAVYDPQNLFSLNQNIRRA